MIMCACLPVIVPPVEVVYLAPVAVFSYDDFADLSLRRVIFGNSRLNLSLVIMSRLLVACSIDKSIEYELVIIRIDESCVHNHTGYIMVVIVDFVVPGGILIIRS